MRALITGVDGQDGFYLKNYLLEQGYEVIGVARKKSLSSESYVSDEECAGYRRIFADLGDLSSLINAVEDARPDEIYNLAGQSEIPLSWRQPLLTAEVNATGVMRLLEAIRLIDPSIRLFQASSSELFGESSGIVCTEDTPFRPRNPYGTAKLFAHHCVENYRDKYGMYACCGIMFNHESPRRSPEFVTRKITMSAARISLGQQSSMQLGNLDAVRDWGSAEDYVKAMWLMLQQQSPDDYVIATGVPHTVRDFATVAFEVLGINVVWEGKDDDEVGRDSATGRELVRIDPALVRLPRKDSILGDPSKAREKLGFYPEHTFRALVEQIVKNDVAVLSGGAR